MHDQWVEFWVCDKCEMRDQMPLSILPSGLKPCIQVP